jgi:hypothetical protein
VETLEEKIKRLSQYLDEEAIARAVDKEVDFVRAVLAGEAVKVKEEKRKDATVVQYVRPSFRQRVICIARVKGGVGATTLALNLAWRVSEKAQVLVIDTQAVEMYEKVYSDFLDLAGAGSYQKTVWDEPEVCELSDNLYYLPFPPGGKVDLETAILEARRDFDAIIVDLPPVSGPEALKKAMVVIYLYGGGEAEGVRLYRLMEETSPQQAVHVAATKKHLLKGEAGWIYLPRADRPGVFDAKSPAAQAVNEVGKEIWGKELAGAAGGGMISKLFRRRAGLNA